MGEFVHPEIDVAHANVARDADDIRKGNVAINTRFKKIAGRRTEAEKSALEETLERGDDDAIGAFMRESPQPNVALNASALYLSACERLSKEIGTSTNPVPAAIAAMKAVIQILDDKLR